MSRKRPQKPVCQASLGQTHPLKPACQASLGQTHPQKPAFLAPLWRKRPLKPAFPAILGQTHPQKPAFPAPLRQTRRQNLRPWSTPHSPQQPPSVSWRGHPGRAPRRPAHASMHAAPLPGSRAPLPCRLQGLDARPISAGPCVAPFASRATRTELRPRLPGQRLSGSWHAPEAAPASSLRRPRWPER